MGILQVTEYYPDCWVVIRMNYKDEVIYKVLGGWSEGYTYGSSWKLNSGIEKAEYDVTQDVWRFYGSSGSVYVCHPDQYGLRIPTIGIWNQMVTNHPDNVKLMSPQDWTEMDWTK